MIAYLVFMTWAVSWGQSSLKMNTCSEDENMLNILKVEQSREDKSTIEIEETKYTKAKTDIEAIIQPDYAYGMRYITEYLADLNNLADWDAGANGFKRIKGFTRNYYTSEQGGKVRLLKKTYGEDVYDNVNCFWYVDGTCVNTNNPQSELYLKKNPGAYKIEAKSNNEVLFSFTAVFVDVPEVVFNPHALYDGEYGFDDNRYDEIARLNDAVYLDRNNKYIIPFMSIQKGQTATLEAGIMYNKQFVNTSDMRNIEVNFVPSSPELLIGRKGSGEMQKGVLSCRLSDFISGKMELDIRPEKVMKDAFIEARIGNSIVGRINIKADVCIDVADLVLVKVVVNKRLGENINIVSEKNKLDELLNEKSFNQAFIRWNIIRTEVLNMEINNEDIKLSDIFAKAVDFYKMNNLKPQKAAVMFISDSDRENDANGYGYVAYDDVNKYSIIHVKALNGKSPAHELAHNLGLEDLGGEFKEYFYDTDNFMDYYSTYNNDNRNMFFKFQWDYIYNQVLSKQRVSLF